MKQQVIIHIKELLQVRSLPSAPLKGNALKTIPKIEDAYLILEDNTVVDFGAMEDFNAEAWTHAERIDAKDRFVLPAFCDSHTHAVFAAYREHEFRDRIQGLSYQEIASKGGGILNSALKISSMSEAELLERSLERVLSMQKSGTGALEIKSGYGLDLANELKLLRVIQQIKSKVDIPVKSTFLAAHALPSAYKNDKDAYVDMIVKEWVPEVVRENLADFVDIFVETGYFDIEDLEKIHDAVSNSGLKLKVHANQFSAFGAVPKACALNALSVDHLEVMEKRDFQALKDSSTMATLLPACSFYLKIPYAPARTLCEWDIPIALASDFNPGSSPTHNLFFIWSLACIHMNLTPEEALNALTINAAFAMGIQDTHGAIFKGYRGKLILTEKAPSIAYFPYAFGDNHLFKMLN